MKTLYISDLDGTLLNQNAEISDYSKEVINKLADNKINFTIATARTIYSVKLILREINIQAPIILMNGAVIYDTAASKFIKIFYISENSGEQIIKIFKRYGTTGFMYKSEKEVIETYYENTDKKQLQDFREERMKKYGKSFKNVESLLNEEKKHIIYFTLLDTKEELEPIYDELSKLEDINAVMYRDIYSDNFWYLEIFSIDASKKSAAEFLRSRYGYEKLVGFGDNINDIPLFEACDEGYAVENAREELKCIATGVIGGNAEDGVAKWLCENVR